MDIDTHEALQVTEKLIKMRLLTDDARVARELHVRMQLPMTAVVERIPGNSVTEKAERAGTTRQAIWRWLATGARPRGPMAKKLARITRYDVREIRGK